MNNTIRICLLLLCAIDFIATLIQVKIDRTLANRMDKIESELEKTKEKNLAEENE